ncbi:MAG: hypothetical protein ACOC0E_09200 [Spirochaetota bacterium]
MVTIQPDGGGRAVALLRDAAPIATLVYRIRTPEGDLYPNRIDVGSPWPSGGEHDDPHEERVWTVAATFDHGAIVDLLSEDGDFVRVERSWTIERPGTWRLLFTTLVPHRAATEWIVPSVMYKENARGRGSFPRGGIDRGWSFREDRISVPACSLLHDDEKVQMVFAEPARRDELVSSVRTYREGTEPAFEIAIPYAEAPAAYRMKGVLFGGMAAARSRWLTVRSRGTPFSYTRTFYVACLPRDGNVFRTFRAAPELVRSRYGDRFAPGMSWSTFASLKLRHLLFLLVDDARRGIHGVQMGRGNGVIQPFYDSTAGSFLAKSLEAACVLVVVGRESGREELVDAAERVGRFFLGGALENGLHRDYFHFRKKRFESHAVFSHDERLLQGSNARCNGEAMLGYVRLHRLLHELGRDIPEFRSIALRNAEFYLSHQLTGERDGSFGRWWSKDGEPINSLGTNGAYIVSLLAALDPEARDARISAALFKAADYYSSLVDANDYYADTLDADCVDKEAGCTTLRAFLDLYERDPEPRYLEKAIDAACYLLSWVFSYDVPFAENTLLAKHAFRTIGMTSVSVAHHHLDFYGMYLAYDFLRLAEHTGDVSWKEWAITMMDACRQLIATVQNPLTRSPAYAGWQPEHVHQTDWKYHNHKLKRKGHADYDTAWVTVLVLGAMVQIRERYPDVLEFQFGTGSEIVDG